EVVELFLDGLDGFAGASDVGGFLTGAAGGAGGGGGAIHVRDAEGLASEERAEQSAADGDSGLQSLLLGLALFAVDGLLGLALALGERGQFWGVAGTKLFGEAVALLAGRLLQPDAEIALGFTGI